jgi:hypothetical protein
MARKLVARNEVGLQMWQDGNDWVITFKVEEIERGEGDDFSDYLDRRYGSAMDEVDEDGNIIEDHYEEQSNLEA